jgi:hypothetical protein
MYGAILQYLSRNIPRGSKHSGGRFTNDTGNYHLETSLLFNGSCDSIKREIIGLWLRLSLQYFNYIVAVSFTGGGNQRKPTCRKTLANFITWYCIKYTSPWQKIIGILNIPVYCITTNQEKEEIRKDMDVNEYKRL